MTASEIREKIIAAVRENGGHLASSLGAVEIAMALREVFEPEVDRIVWDVGHQAYAWKILTGRDADFATIRRRGGLAPFPLPSESRADAAVAGHAGVALSLAEGIASADRCLGRTGRSVVAVVGDAALANGTSLEALERISSSGKVIVVLNDNGSKRFGKSFFDAFGLDCLGPVDGHDVSALAGALAEAKARPRPVVVHAITKKGKGYPPAENDPARWHAVGSSADGDGKPRDWSGAFGEALVRLAREDGRIVALTAAMKEGTGLGEFAREFPERFFDAGIAEGHMVSFAAGLAAGGMRPVVAVYSTFLQRSIDQVMHDVAISSLPVVFCVDRAGAVGADGVTHQGMFDIAMLRCLPNLAICQPCDEQELQAMLKEALSRNGPTVIRYPRGILPAAVLSGPCSGPAVQVVSPDAKTQIWAAGDQLAKALAVAGKTGCGVVYARYLKPHGEELLLRQRREGKRIVSLENAAVSGGFGEAIGAELKFGWPDRFMPHAEVCELEREAGFDVEAITEAING